MPKPSSELCLRVRRGDLEGVRELLDRERSINVNAYDRMGRTALMHAATGPRASLEIAQALLEQGADPDRRLASSGLGGARDETAVSFALGAGDPAMIELLVEHGATLRYRRRAGYDALLDAVHGRDLLGDERLLDLLRLLIDRGVALDGISSYKETACRVLSRIGRFDAIGLLLDAGADPAQLGWSALIRAVALGTVRDVERELDRGASLEDKDWWERTAWLVALLAGEVDKAKLLRERGADTAQRGRCGTPAVFYAIDSGRPEILEWLRDIGVDLAETDDFGTTALVHAASQGDLAAVEALLQAGADVNAGKAPGPIVAEDLDPDEVSPATALYSTSTAAVAKRLLDAGANPADLDFSARRMLVGLPAETDSCWLEVSSADFRAGRSPRSGGKNPEKMEIPFWSAMIRAGVGAYEASARFDDVERLSPVWCAQRYGQSITFLPDGRIVQIAGEHEDAYHPDFYIYNDVFVHHPDGSVEIFGYPPSTFPPTDFHTATRVGDDIYVIGSLGYPDARRKPTTPVFKLDTKTFRMQSVAVEGDGPGRIYSHIATQPAPWQIRVSGGNVVTVEGDREAHRSNKRAFVLDLRRLAWSDGEP